MFTMQTERTPILQNNSRMKSIVELFGLVDIKADH